MVAGRISLFFRSTPPGLNSACSTHRKRKRNPHVPVCLTTPILSGMPTFQTSNGEDNRDGESNNLGWNCGVEGPTDDPAVRLLRSRQKRNLVGTLLLSQGVPMIRAGDELGHTQNGNNNAYCQDSQISWLPWQLSDEQREFVEFVRELVQLRHDQPVLRRPKFFQGRAIRGTKDISWFEPSGEEMTDEAWQGGFGRSIGVRLAGDAIDNADERGERLVGDTLMLLLNAHDGEINFQLPPAGPGAAWQVVADTACSQAPSSLLPADAPYPLQGRSLVVLKVARPEKADSRATAGL
jgi:isoamylase